MDSISVQTDMLHLRKANPTLVFLLIAFGVPWSVQLFMALKRIPLIPVWPGLIVANSFCSVAGFVAAYCELGWAGVTELGRRCVRYRASKGWWAYTLLLNFGIANVITLAYGLVHGVVGPLRLQDLARQWWLPFTFLFGFMFGPLGEEAGWRGYLLPRLLRQHSPLVSSLILGLISAFWHFPVGLLVGSALYFHSVMGLLLFTAGAMCMNILITILVLHTRMSVLHAIVFHWTIMPSVTISEIIFPPVQQPPDWVRAIGLIAVTLVATMIFRKRLWRAPLPSSASSNSENEQVVRLM
jgi:membrane protease YdiL (CAAX protease family)